MKIYALLPMLLLGACIQTVKPAEETVLVTEEETGITVAPTAYQPVQQSQEGGYVQQQSVAPAPVYNNTAPMYQQPIQNNTYIPQQSQAAQPAYVPQQTSVQQPVSTLAVSGTTIDLPAQQIYIPDTPTETYNQAFLGAQTVQQTQSIPSYQPVQSAIPAQQPGGYQPIQAQATPVYPQPISYTQPQQQSVQPAYQQADPYYAAKPPVDIQPVQAEAVVITLQHPAQQGTLAQCLSTDAGCIASYEQQGFVQVRHMPQFAGYQEISAPSDYPAGQWRNQNNIPRW